MFSDLGQNDLHSRCWRGDDEQARRHGRMLLAERGASDLEAGPLLSSSSSFTAQLPSGLGALRKGCFFFF